MICRMDTNLTQQDSPDGQKHHKTIPSHRIKLQIRVVHRKQTGLHLHARLQVHMVQQSGFSPLESLSAPYAKGCKCQPNT